MSDRPPIACSNCGAASTNGTWVCDACKKAAPATASGPARARYKPTAQMDEIDRFYKTKPWERCSQAIRTYNPICQHVIDGKQCSSQSQEVHHLESPRQNFARRFDPANLVALCHTCHRPTEGEPEDDFREYAPTKAYGGVQFEHPTRPKQGEVRITEGGRALVG